VLKIFQSLPFGEWANRVEQGGSLFCILKAINYLNVKPV